MSPKVDATPCSRRSDTVQENLAKLASESNLTCHLPCRYFLWSISHTICLCMVHTHHRCFVPVYVSFTSMVPRGCSRDFICHSAKNTHSRLFMSTQALFVNPEFKQYHQEATLTLFSLKVVIRSPPHPAKLWSPQLPAGRYMASAWTRAAVILSTSICVLCSITLSLHGDAEMVSEWPLVVKAR